MMLEDLSNTWLVGFLLTGAAVAGLLTVGLLRRRRDAWKRFAKVHRLSYEESAECTRVSGIVDGRAFELATVKESSDTGALGVEEVLMALELSGRVPQGLLISRGGPLLGQAQKALEENVVETGDDTFDQQSVVQAESATEAIAYLNEPRRTALLKLLAIDEEYRAGLENSRIFIEHREMISRLEELEAHFELLRKVARELDREE